MPRLPVKKKEGGGGSAQGLESKGILSIYYSYRVRNHSILANGEVKVVGPAEPFSGQDDKVYIFRVRFPLCEVGEGGGRRFFVNKKLELIRDRGFSYPALPVLEAPIIEKR